MSEQEVVLAGGNSSKVVKVGKTVHRDLKPQSAFVHALLQHLEKVGFEHAPSFLGIDEQNREILSFLEGEDGNYPLRPYMMTEEMLVEVAQLIRRFHDCTQDFVIPEGSVFGQDVMGEREVICHNDFAPYNCIFKDNHLAGIIDFDIAAPGTRLWDIAYAVYRFAPLTNVAHSKECGWDAGVDKERRLKLFCDTYGLDSEERLRLIDEVIRRIQYMIDYMESHSMNLHHVDIYKRDVAYIEENRDAFISALK
jgi:thiamine kinase-like enzyme